jgi:hypothetical protein
MPAAIPTYDALANYPPAIAQALTQAGRFVLTFPVTFNTADAAVLYTVPAGVRVSVERAFWEPTTSWTGGTASAIGVSSSNTNYTTKGDLLGGATGDVAAGLVSTGAPFKGTIGAKAATQGVIVLVAGDTIRFDRITSAFTAGAGNVHIPVTIIPVA